MKPKFTVHIVVGPRNWIWQDQAALRKAVADVLRELA
jgi:hypothetical protein